MSLARRSLLPISSEEFYNLTLSQFPICNPPVALHRRRVSRSKVDDMIRPAQIALCAVLAI